MAATRAQTDGPPAGAKCKVKLPKLELQRFRGAATEWQSFWERFEQAVHGNDGLSNAEKFLYLRSVLSGKAAAAIAGIQVTGANDTTVIELLKERFGRRDMLIQEHLTQLLDLPPVKNEKEHIGLHRLYDHLQRNIDDLLALGVKTDSYGALLSSALLRMLPTDLVGYHKGLSAAGKDDVTSIKSLQVFLKTEVESREKALQPGNLATRESKHRDREKSKPQKGPFLLATTVRHHLSTTGDYPEIRKTIRESLYVDDLITRANRAEEAVFRNDLKLILPPE
nr:uncharacterized protein LOC126517647 [Dermacentor andersoni]